MIRSAIVMTCVVCVATIAAQLLGLAFLWYHGQLNSDTVQEIGSLLRGQTAGAATTEENADQPQPSMADVVELRAIRAFDLGAREGELLLLKQMVSERRESLLAEKVAFDQEKQAFQQQLERLNADISSEATEQARSILLALPPDEQAYNLMQLDLQQNVVLLKGMTGKSIGKVLSALHAGTPEQQQRGAELFQALSEGEPVQSLIESPDSRSGQPASILAGPNPDANQTQ